MGGGGASRDGVVVWVWVMGVMEVVKVVEVVGKVVEAVGVVGRVGMVCVCVGYSCRARP